MKRRLSISHTQAGETLAEVLVAVAILGIAVTALMGGIAASSVGSDVHRKQASAEVALRAYAEAVERATFATTCGTAATNYSATALGLPTTPGYVFSAPAVVAQSPGTCATLQSVTLSVVTSRTTLSVQLVKAAP
jgi:prepilin-type N-terminal cleavage/methylation domain-containing protein